MLNAKAAIFDLDGTLIDSLGVWADIDEEYLGKFNLTVPDDLSQDIQHLTVYETANYFKKRFNISDSAEDMLLEWHSMALDKYRNEIKLKAGVREFLDLLKENNIKIGLATSNVPLLVEACLKNNGIYDYFETIVTTSEIGKNKDNPDVYLLAASRLNVDPSECFVFEDILPAIHGAKKANMTVVAIEDKFSSKDKEMIQNACDIYVSCYFEFANQCGLKALSTNI